MEEAGLDHGEPFPQNARLAGIDASGTDCSALFSRSQYGLLSGAVVRLGTQDAQHKAGADRAEGAERRARHNPRHPAKTATLPQLEPNVIVSQVLGLGAELPFHERQNLDATVQKRASTKLGLLLPRPYVGCLIAEARAPGSDLVTDGEVCALCSRPPAQPMRKVQAQMALEPSLVDRECGDEPTARLQHAAYLRKHARDLLWRHVLENHVGDHNIKHAVRKRHAPSIDAANVGEKLRRHSLKVAFVVAVGVDTPRV